MQVTGQVSSMMTGVHSPCHAPNDIAASIVGKGSGPGGSPSVGRFWLMTALMAMMFSSECCFRPASEGAGHPSLTG